MVVGYLKEQFQTLEEEYPGLKLIDNPWYDTCNNIASLYVAREHLENAFILDGDQIIYHPEILAPEFERSGYNSVWTDDETDEWLQTVENGIVTGCSRTGGKGGWQLYSISRWTAEDGKRLKGHLEQEFEVKKNRQIYWDDVAMFCYPKEYQLGIRPMKAEDYHRSRQFSASLLHSMHRMRITQKGKKMNSKNQQKKKEIDWMITLVPLALIVALCIVFFFAPEQSNQVLGQIRFLFGDTFGTYYLVIGLGIFFLSLFLAGSKYGNIVLGKPDEKPKYSFLSWGCMMFTCGLAADILFYSFSEWIMYATNPHIKELGSIQEWAGVFPLFHWSFIPWAFYLVLAVAFGFMLHVRKRNRQKYSEACRPVLGKHTDGFAGRIIDLLAVFALLAGTATTFSVATPLMATIIGDVFHISLSRTAINIIILIITCIVYTYSLLHGFKGISILAKVCIYFSLDCLLLYCCLAVKQDIFLRPDCHLLALWCSNFIGLSTYTDPLT